MTRLRTILLNSLVTLVAAAVVIVAMVWLSGFFHKGKIEPAKLSPASRPAGGVPTTTVACAVVSQFSAAARDNSSGPVSPRTTASTTLASIRLSQLPRASAASA